MLRAQLTFNLNGIELNQMLKARQTFNLKQIKCEGPDRHLTWMESNQILKAQQTLNLNQVESNATPTSKSKLTNRCCCVCHAVAVVGPPVPPNFNVGGGLACRCCLPGCHQHWHWGERGKARKTQFLAIRFSRFCGFLRYLAFSIFPIL